MTVNWNWNLKSKSLLKKAGNDIFQIILVFEIFQQKFIETGQNIQGISKIDNKIEKMKCCFSDHFINFRYKISLRFILICYKAKYGWSYNYWKISNDFKNFTFIFEKLFKLFPFFSIFELQIEGRGNIYLSLLEKYVHNYANLQHFLANILILFGEFKNFCIKSLEIMNFWTLAKC